MATFAGITCDSVRGYSRALTERVITFTRPGIDGHGALALGAAAEANTYTLTKYGTYAQVLAWAQSVEAMVGQIVSITDDWGTLTPLWLFTATDTPQIIRADRGTGSALARGQVRARGMSQ